MTFSALELMCEGHFLFPLRICNGLPDPEIIRQTFYDNLWASVGWLYYYLGMGILYKASTLMGLDHVAFDLRFVVCTEYNTMSPSSRKRHWPMSRSIWGYGTIYAKWLIIRFSSCCPSSILHSFGSSNLLSLYSTTEYSLSMSCAMSVGLIT